MSNPTMPEGYYDRFDESKNYEKSLFLAGKVLQSAELNEVQDTLSNRARHMFEVLFKDGSIVKDAQIIIDPITGITQCQAGVIYLLGACRGVAPATITIPVVGTVYVGIRLVKTVVSFLQDPALRDPAVGLRNYTEAGASRLKYEITWGWDGDNGDGDFYPIYTVIDGIPETKEPPPDIDAIGLAIAAYDRQSTGGMYTSNGLMVTMLADDGDNQVYSIQEGLARIFGRLVVIPTAMRVLYPATPDLRHNVSEPHTCSGGTETLTLNEHPVVAVTAAVVTKQVTETVVRGTTRSTEDALTNSSIVSVLDVFQGATHFTAGSGYLIDGDSIDWSPNGTQPATGSTYSVTYQYEVEITPNSSNATSVSITGAVAGSVAHFWYDSALPRYDKLCLDQSGRAQWVKGVAARVNQMVPQVPPSMMGLATVYQSWTATGRTLKNDGTRMVSMGEIEQLHYNVIDLYDLIAENQLAIDVVGRVTGAKHGLFADSFRDDGYRDDGLSQDLIVTDQSLQLGIAETILSPSGDIHSPVTMAYTHKPILSQLSRTASMQINPYMSFAPVPARVVLNPCVDNAVQIVNIVTETHDWAPSHFHFFKEFHERHNDEHDIKSVGTRTITFSNLFLREIQVNFTITGFGSGEQLTSVLFDSLNITSSVG